MLAGQVFVKSEEMFRVLFLFFLSFVCQFFFYLMSETTTSGNGPENNLQTIPVETAKCPKCGSAVNVLGMPAFTEMPCPTCGATITVPARFDHFLLLKHLGSGGMGSAFLAEDEQLGRQVAVKVMQKALGSDEKAFEVFKNEAQSAARLNHPNVAQIHSFGAWNGSPYLEMELVPGGSLQDFIDAKVKLDPAFVIRVGYEIAQGLQAAEGVGLFHGDVKPDNILFDADMKCKLVDFGIASRSNQGKSDELWGTPYYIAPEKIQKKVNSARSDIYSLGATLYHAIACQPPYDGADAVEVIRARFKGPPVPLEQLRVDLEPEAAHIITRMMYNDLFMRYPNYSSLLGDMSKYLEKVSQLRKQGPRNPKLTHSIHSGSAIMPSEGIGGTTNKTKKKFVIQKGQMQAAEQQREMAAAGQEAMTQGPSKIRFKTRKDQAPAKPADAEGAETPEIEETEQPEERREKGGGNALKIAVISIFAVVALLILGGIGFFVHQVVSTRENARQFEALKAASEEQADVYINLENDIKKNVEKAKALDAKMEPIFKTIIDTVRTATRGQELTIPDLEPPPPKPEPVEEAAPAESAPAGDAAASGTGEKPAEAPPVKKEPPVTRLAKKMAADLGFESPSMSELMEIVGNIKKEAKAAGKEPEAYALEQLGEAEPAAEEEASAAEVPAEKEPAEEVSPLIGKALERLTPPAKIVRNALRVCERISAEELEGEGNPFESIPANAPEAVARRSIQRRQEALAHRKQNIAEMERQLALAEDALRKLQFAQQQVARDARPFLNRIQREEQEAAAKAAAEAEEARKAAALAAEKARDEEEISRVRSVVESYQKLVDTFQYEKCKEQLKRMDGELLTKAGKEELAIAMGRMDSLISLRAWILKDLKARPLKKGFRKRYDIEGVSVTGTELLIGQSQPKVAVANLTVADWVSLFWPLLENRDTKRGGLSTHERGTQLWNAAVFCYMHANGNVSALERSKQLAEAAFKYRAGLRNGAEKVIPILGEAAAGAKEESDALSAF